MVFLDTRYLVNGKKPGTVALILPQPHGDCTLQEMTTTEPSTAIDASVGARYVFFTPRTLIDIGVRGWRPHGKCIRAGRGVQWSRPMGLAVADDAVYVRCTSQSFGREWTPAEKQPALSPHQISGIPFKTSPNIMAIRLPIRRARSKVILQALHNS